MSEAVIIADNDFYEALDVFRFQDTFFPEYQLPLKDVAANFMFGIGYNLNFSLPIATVCQIDGESAVPLFYADANTIDELLGPIVDLLVNSKGADAVKSADQQAFTRELQRYPADSYIKNKTDVSGSALTQEDLFMVADAIQSKGTYEIESDTLAREWYIVEPQELAALCVFSAGLVANLNQAEKTSVYDDADYWAALEQQIKPVQSSLKRIDGIIQHVALRLVGRA